VKMKNMKKSKTTLITILALALACTPAMAGGVQDRQAQVKSMLWRVSQPADDALDAAASPSAWLLGTLPFLNPENTPIDSLPAAVRNAMAVCGRIVFEADPALVKDGERMMKLIEQSGGIYPPGQYDVFDQFGEPFRSRLLNLTGQLGLPRRALSTFKPWLLAITLYGSLTIQAGYDPADTLDNAIYERALAESIPTDYLTDPLSELRRIDAMPVTAQKSLLIQIVREAFTFTGDVPLLIDAWKAGDLAYIARYQQDEWRGHSAAQRIMETEPKIEITRRLMRAIRGQDEDTLYVVTTTLLAGVDGVLELFRQNGWRVERVE